MQFLQKALAEALAKIGPFVPKQSALPVLRGVYIVTQGDRLVTIEATDLETGAIVTCEAERTGGPSGLTEGPIVLPYADLLAAVKAFKNDRSIELHSNEVAAVVSNGKRSIAIAVLAASDYPELPHPDDVITKLDTEVDLADVIARLAVAAGRDQARPILTGICLDPRPDDETGSIDLVATDSYRMAMFRGLVFAKLADRNVRVLWPATAALKAAKLTGCEAVHIAETRTWFGGVGCVAWVRHIDGEFPKWRSLLPGSYPIAWTFDRKAEGFAGLADVKKIAEDIPVRLRIDDEGDAILTITKSGAEAYRSSVGGKLIGDALEIALKPAFLLEGLAILSGAVTKMEAIDSMKPILLSGDDELEYLQMPVRM